jgi:hypothetical protein
MEKPRGEQREWPIILKKFMGRNNRLLSFNTTWTALKKTRPTILLYFVYSLPRERIYRAVA